MHQHFRHVPLNSLFCDISNVHYHLKRLKSEQNIYILSKISTNRCQQSTKYQGTKIWNSIPLNLTKSFSKFKYECKKLLLNRYKLLNKFEAN